MMATSINGMVIFAERLRTNNNCISCTDAVNEEEDNQAIERVIDDVLEPMMDVNAQML